MKNTKRMTRAEVDELGYLEKTERKAKKQEFYYCAECGQEFRRKERTCSCCGNTNIIKGER